jgi:small subunit ribosomal protein S26e
MPISTAPYRRRYKHTASRGSEATVRCDFCGREVPRYKTFVVNRRFRISDPTLLKQLDRRMIHMFSRKMRACPSCARFRGIIRPGKSVRKKHMVR